MNDRQAREHNERVVLAWNTARLSLADPTKFPKLETLLINNAPAVRQTKDQMVSVIKAMNFALGGEVKT